MSGTINFAILGAGVSARFHRRAIEASADLGARLVAVGHYDPARYDDIGSSFGVPCVSLGELLTDRTVDVVCLCTPSGQHAEQAIAAAEAGKHLLVDKPMALSLADADAMIAACERAGVKLGIHYQRRAMPLFQQVRRAIASGALGELTLGLVTMPYYRSQAYYDQAAWRGTWSLDGGGVLMNQGIHIVDLLVWFLGDPVDVQARGGPLRREIEVEDTLVATLRFENGSLATITATTTAVPGFPHRIEIYGTEGGIQIEAEAVKRWRDADGDGQPPAELKQEAAGGHEALVRDFILALREDRPPAADGVEGRRSLAAVLQIYRAAGLT
jgi:predicted dehydrogenase